MTGYRKKVCRGCGRIYYRRLLRNVGAEGWCSGRCYLRAYHRSLKEADNECLIEATGVERNEPSGPVAICEEIPKGRKIMNDNEKSIGFNLDLVAERPLVARTRFDENGIVGVEWRGRCWVWLNGDEAPALMEVVVSDGETARVLFPGQVRRVRATVRAFETDTGRVAGLDVLADLGWEARAEPRAAVRGLHEGAKVRIGGAMIRSELKGKSGTLLRFTSATVEVDGRRYSVGVRGLEPLSEPPSPPNGAAGEPESGVADVGQD